MNTKAKCGKCGDTIESKHVHDFRRCSCGSIFVDGGSEYFRCGGDFRLILIEDEDGQEKSLETIFEKRDQKREENAKRS